ncbi:PHP domain-like protein [Dothidotthia symphoricarpi CBS 119687]|uniref:PHP domain-like protein n=1 Tax=Dothidotthia symphoricarpi CBS 119687 TaxID=1392245 RepID=A0A6A6ANB9_9PLEO|nr:PHP domain-like protein [Dothidotthia symphoricarpi CBS 119687]KAF2132683.1 PHP domain-like protein [Dothidotthia symphoricarpi CBS 119687]
MFHDLHVPWSDGKEHLRELQRTVAFCDELGYHVVALTTTYAGKLPADLTSPVPNPLPFPTPPRLRVLRRCNVFLTDAASNFRIPQLQQHYDLVAARPTDERTLQQACQSLDVDIISLDLTRRFEKHFKFPMLGAAISRGIKIELCYSQGIMSTDPMAKRNLISNATQLIRATRGRGLIFSSEAKSVLGIRAPSDVINLASVWGLGTERGKDGLTKEPRSVVEFARLKRQSFKGIVDIVYGGEKPAIEAKDKQGPKANKNKNQNGKRPGESLDSMPIHTSKEDKPISKREQKRNKMAKMDAEQHETASSTS